MSSRYLQENFAPVREELTVTDLEVTGHLPDHLDGRSSHRPEPGRGSGRGLPLVPR